MCYDIKASYEAQLKRAIHKNDLQAIEEIMEKLIPLTDLPIYHASGFSHPDLLIYTDRSRDYPEVATWGLIPHWVNDQDQVKQLWNNTLNARGETIFEKPSFRESALNQRCIIYVDGFYEHHHFNNKTFPFYIHSKKDKPLALAGLWNEWNAPNSRVRLKTFTIVTTQGNNLMTKIHNNPKLKGPRMPVILTEETEDIWLSPIKKESDMNRIKELIKSYPDKNLSAHTVQKLRGKEYIGNVQGISEKYTYEELEY